MGKASLQLGCFNGTSASFERSSELGYCFLSPSCFARPASSSVPSSGAKAWITTSGEIMLTSNCRLYSSGLIYSSGPPTTIPALLTRPATIHRAPVRQRLVRRIAAFRLARRTHESSRGRRRTGMDPRAEAQIENPTQRSGSAGSAPPFWRGLFRRRGARHRLRVRRIRVRPAKLHSCPHIEKLLSTVCFGDKQFHVCFKGRQVLEAALHQIPMARPCNPLENYRRVAGPEQLSMSDRSISTSLHDNRALRECDSCHCGYVRYLT